jgi:predicted house-cleaning NTP pyrophosphatase (Maf/HAM1 superfamily)
LSEAGYEFTTVWPDIDESAFVEEGISPCEYAERLALAKAKSVAEKHPLVRLPMLKRRKRLPECFSAGRIK